MTRHVLTAVAWPYTNGPRHIGHVSGFGVPSDVFSRYMRMSGHDVLMVSGTDEHGTPILVLAEQEGVSPRELADRYNRVIVQDLHDLGLSYDLFTRTTTRNHYAVAQEMFKTLYRNGYMIEKTTMGAISPSTGRTLPDRFIEGTCPICGYDGARGDQCDNCGRQLDAEELINPRSRINGETPEFVETEHFFLDLPALADTLGQWLQTRTDWRPNVLKFSLNLLDDVRPRAMTRDIDWGVPVPLPGWEDNPNKRLYVWFDAVIGYLSAAKEWAASTDDPDAWKRWWEDSEAESYYFVGKDNIPFHTVIWPAMLMGYGGLNLPTDVPANQYITFKGMKASKSQGVGRPISWYADRLEPDAIRYAIASVLPEQNDTDLSDGDIIRRVNEELVATWGNLVNRVLSMSDRHFEGRVPPPGSPTPTDEALIASVDKAMETTAAHIEAVELRAGLRTTMDAASEVNAYLNSEEPWHVIKEDRERAGTILWTAIQAISGIRVSLAPYMPASATRLGTMLGIGEVVTWERPVIEGGAALGSILPLFTKLEPDVLDV